jgi:hypothetical protein
VIMAKRPLAKRKAKTAKPITVPDRKEEQTTQAALPAEGEVGLAATILDPAAQCVMTLKMLEKNVSAERLSPDDCYFALHEQIKAVNKGNKGRVEAMLITQSHTLDWLFNNTLQRAYRQEYLPNYEMLFRLGLRAQAQCARTLEVLAAIKNPPVVFAKQANMTTGPQQVNNGVAAIPPAQENIIQQNKLSGDGHELLPNIGTSTPASQVDSRLETVGKIDRAKVGGGKG